MKFVMPIISFSTAKRTNDCRGISETKILSFLYTFAETIKQYDMERQFISTGFDFEGYKITKYYGIVRGIIVRSRSIIGNIGAGFQALV